MNEFNKYHYNYYFTERSFICVLYWKLMFFVVFRRGNPVVGFTGEERSICGADEKCGQMSGNSPSGCHGVIRTLSDAKWSSGGLDLDKFYSIRFVKSRSNWKLQTLVLWCFRFHFLMHIWSLTSVEFNEHFWDMVKFSLVFIRFLDKLLRFRGFLHKFMNLKSNFLWWMKWNSWFSYQIFLMESRRCFRGISFWI